MARLDIATLAVKITGSATELDKEIDRAGKRLAGFSNTLTGPMNQIRGIGTGISDMVAKPIGSMITDITRFTSMIPGLGAISGVMAHPVKAAEDAFHRLDALGDQAKRTGLGAQFLRGLQLAADEEAGSIEPTMLKLLKFQSQLNSGSDDLLSAGGKSATKKALELGLNKAEWMRASPEQLFELFAAGAQKAAESGTEFAFATDIGGKGASKLMGTLREGGWQEWIEKVKAANVATERAMALTEQWDRIQKEVGLKTESAQESVFGSGGLMSIGFGQMATGSGALGGMSDVMQGAQNYLTEAFGGEGELPGDMARTLFNNAFQTAQGAMDAVLQKGSVKDYANIKPLEEMMAKINEMAEHSTRTGATSLTKAAMLSQMISQAKKMMPGFKKGPGDLDDEPAKALETVLEPMADMTQIAAIQAMQKAMRTPAEKLEDELYDLNQLQQSGMLGDETYQRALEKMKKSATGPKRAGATEAGVAEAGSQEWAKAFNRMSESSEETDDEGVEEQKRTNVILGDIERLLDKRPEPKVLNAPP